MICIQGGEQNSLPKINYEKIIKYSPDLVFKTFTDYESFEKRLPQYFPSIRIRSRRDNVAVIEEHVCFGKKEIVWMAKHVTEYPDLHETFVIGGQLKGSHIIEKYYKVDEGTRLVIKADIKIGAAMQITEFIKKTDVVNDFKSIIDGFVQLVH